MRLTCALVASFLAASAHAQDLRDQLLALADEGLQSKGLSIDHDTARVYLSAPLPATGSFEIRPTWGGSVSLPLTFSVRRGSTEIRATLAAAWRKEVAIATRSVSNGSPVSCADVAVGRVDVRRAPHVSLAIPCSLPAGSVALRDIAARDVIRGGDVGSALDVTAGAPVRVTVSAGAITISAPAVALANARVGDEIEVRMQRPSRILRTRVTGPGMVQPMDGA